jgi:hypothetical protein
MGGVSESEANAAGGCLHAKKDQKGQDRFKQALHQGGVHTVIVTIGPCQQGTFTLAAVVRVDGQETIRCGLEPDDVGDFIAMIHNMAAGIPNVVIYTNMDKTGSFVVPCPPH